MKKALITKKEMVAHLTKNLGHMKKGHIAERLEITQSTLSLILSRKTLRATGKPYKPSYKILNKYFELFMK